MVNPYRPLREYIPRMATHLVPLHVRTGPQPFLRVTLALFPPPPLPTVI